jgi:hypothetical protein
MNMFHVRCNYKSGILLPAFEKASSVNPHGGGNYWVLAFDILKARVLIPIPPAPSRVNLNLTRLYLALRSILDLSPTVRHSLSRRPAIRILDSGIWNAPSISGTMHSSLSALSLCVSSLVRAGPFYSAISWLHSYLSSCS